MDQKKQYKITTKNIFGLCDITVLVERDASRLKINADGFVRIGFKKSNIVGQSTYEIKENNKNLIESYLSVAAFNVNENYVNGIESHGIKEIWNDYNNEGPLFDSLGALYVLLNINNEFDGSENKKIVLMFGNKLNEGLLSTEKGGQSLFVKEKKIAMYKENKLFLILKKIKIEVKIEESNI